MTGSGYYIIYALARRWAASKLPLRRDWNENELAF